MQISPSKPLRMMGVQHRADLVPLTENEVRFEIDMCIGCDRCMRACPVPLSAMVNIADLNLATVSDEIAPHVTRFTQECVMCGSCVPVCPVNNHRDLLMLSLKQRLGIPWDGSVDMSLILDYMPAGWDVPHLLSRIRDQPMFSDPELISDNYLLHFIARSKLLQLLPGTAVLKEGEFWRGIYFILEGRFVVSSAGNGGQGFPQAVLRPGGVIGGHWSPTGPHGSVRGRAQ